MTVVSDNFNRANGSSLGASWTETKAGLNFTISSNQATPEGAEAPIARYNTSTDSTDHRAKLTVVSWSANGIVGPACRMDTSAGTCYYMVARNNATSTYRIFYWDGASANLVGSAVSTTPPTAPFTAEIQAEGTTIRGYINDVEVISRTDSTLTTQTHVGMYCSNASGTSQVVDNWEGGALSDLVVDAVTITNPVQWFTAQRDANDQADITIDGTYTGSPTAIEARFNGGTWTTIDSSLSGGVYSGTLTCDAGQGTLEVRFANDTGVTASVTKIGVGDVFLCTGQSNSAGHGDNNQSYSHATLDAAMWDPVSSGWTELLDPTAEANAYGSMWPLLATRIMADQGVPVAFIPMGVGSTNSSVWVPGALRYENAVDAVTASGVNGVKAVIHYQGEADANTGTDAATFQSRLESMIEGFASDLPGAPPVVLFMLANNVYAGLDTIREVIQTLWARTDCYAGPVLYDIDLTAGDSLHLETDAQLGIGADRCWVALTGLYAGTGDVRTRAVAAVKVAADTIEVRCNRTLTSATVSEVPWHVTDQTGDNDVTAAVASGNKVTLTLTRDLDGAATVDYVQGDEAGGLDAPTATIDTIEVVLEPMYAVSVTEASSSGSKRTRTALRIRNVARV